jgi:hypothetical protein
MPHHGFELAARGVGAILKSAIKDTMDELVQRYSRQGHPSEEELVAAQGLTFPRDPKVRLGNFWPEEESIDDFLTAMREWRGHTKTDPAASPGELEPKACRVASIVSESLCDRAFTT